MIVQQKRHIKLMMDWVILYKIREAFNVLYWIGDGIGNGFNGKSKGGRYFELVCSAGSVWLDTQSQYCGIDDTPTTTTKIKTYRINNWRILYTRGEAFNGWYWIGDGIEERFNGVANKGGWYFELLLLPFRLWFEFIFLVLFRFRLRLGFQLRLRL